MAAGPGLSPTGLGAMPHKSPVRRSVRLQFLMDVAQATFNQPCGPTRQQVEALQRTLSLVPLEELGLSPQQLEQQRHEVHSSSSSRSCSPGLGDGAHMLHDELERERGRPYPCTESEALDPRPPITYLLIYEDARVSLGIFCLPARAKIPLHNHPGMTVLSRVLYGDMHVCSYDWVEPRESDAVELPRQARRVVDSTLTAADQPTVLYPDAGGNIHEFTALTDCAVLDLMSPPYSTEDGRDCTYYSIVSGMEQHQSSGDSSLVLLSSFEPPLDFVINQGRYRGVTPRRKRSPPSSASSQSGGSGGAASGGDQSPTTSVHTAGGQEGHREPLPQQPSSPLSSPSSAATTHSGRSGGGGERSSLIEAPSS